MKTIFTRVLVTLFVLFAPGLFGCKTSQKYPPIIYTQQDFQEFWRTHARPFVVGREIEPPELVEEFDRLLERIRLRYDNEVVVRILTNNCTFSVDPMDAYVSNNVPLVEISLLHFMDIHKRCHGFGGDAEARYWKTFTVYYFHQLHKLSYGHVATDMAARRNPKVKWRHERATWPMTITNVIEVIGRGDNLLSIVEDEVLYNAWLIARELKSPELWNRYLIARYSKPP